MSLKRRFRASLVDLAILGLLSGQSSFLLHKRPPRQTPSLGRLGQPVPAAFSNSLREVPFAWQVATISRIAPPSSCAPLDILNIYSSEPSGVLVAVTSSRSQQRCRDIGGQFHGWGRTYVLRRCGIPVVSGSSGWIVVHGGASAEDFSCGLLPYHGQPFHNPVR